VAWKTGVDGSWWQASNWTALPQTGDDVSISAAGTYKVTLGPDAAANLTLASLTIADATATLDIEAHGTHDTIGSLNITGLLQVGPSDHSLSADITLDVGQLTLSGNGAFELYGSPGARVTLNVDDTAPSTLSTGYYALDGNSLLQFAGGEIDAVGAGGGFWINGRDTHIAVAGHSARNSALANFSSNAGYVYIGGGTVLGNQNHSFTNSGFFTIFSDTTVKTNYDFTTTNRLFLDFNTGDPEYGGSRLIVGGTLTNSGMVLLGGLLQERPDAIVATELVNTGVLDIGEFNYRGVPNPLYPLNTLTVKDLFQNSGRVFIDDSGAVTNTGHYLQSDGETIVGAAFGARTLDIAGGVLEGIGTVIGDVRIEAGGAITGSGYFGQIGTLTVHGRLVVNGTVEADMIAAGSGTSTAVAVDGDRVVLKGATLSVNLSDPQNLHAGETFDILDFTPGTLRGHFASITDGTHSGDGHSLDLGNGTALQVVYENDAGHIELLVTATSSEMPATSIWHDLGLI